jgi:hypothetical protein
MTLQQQARDLDHRVGGGAVLRVAAEGALESLPTGSAGLPRLDTERRQVRRNAAIRAPPVEERAIE